MKSGTLAIKGGREQGKDDTDQKDEKDAKEKGSNAEKTPAPVNTPRETIAARPGDGVIDLPVQVLITTGTSGPAEIFAAALDGNKRADLVGERTVGRAGIQKLVTLPESRGLWLTYARYLTPGGDVIQGKGLKPDVAVDDVDVTDFGTAAATTDPILDAALARVAKKAA